MKLLIEVAKSGPACEGCPWHDRAAAGACTLWGRAMTSGRRIPECLEAEIAWEQERETAHQRGRYAALCEAIKRVRRDAATEPLTPQQQHGVDHAITVLENLGDDIFYRKGKATP